MKTPILGQSYVLPSLNAANNEMINLYPEVIPGNQGKEIAYLKKISGIKELYNIGIGPIRGMYNTQNFLFVVSGEKLYSQQNNEDFQEIGTILDSAPIVTMADNGTQLFICSAPNGYIYNMVTKELTPITDIDFPGCGSVAYISGFFVFNQPNTTKIWYSEALNGTEIGPSNFFSSEYSPDLVTFVKQHRGELWIFNSKTTEVWDVQGDVDFLFTPNQGATNQIGTISPNSVVELANSLFFIGADNTGNAIIYRTSGYTPIRISTHAVEYAIQKFSDISSAIAYGYQEYGHFFYVLNFPDSNITYVYDLTTEMWHKRGSFKDSKFKRQKTQNFIFYNGKNLLGSYLDGKIYELSEDFLSDGEDLIKWVRSWRALPSGTNTLSRTTQYSLQIDCESGVGLSEGLGNDPQIMLQWSDDGGHTWSNEHQVSMGKVGEYFTRVIFRKVGTTEKLRDRVFMITGSDPVKVIINGAELEAILNG